MILTTTICAVEHEGGVTLGWDSQVSAGSQQWIIGDSKAFVNNGTVFLFSGLLRDLNVLKHADLPRLDTWDVDQWVTNRLIPAMQKVLVDYGAAKNNSGEVSVDNGILAVVDGRVYDIDGGFGWSRREDGIYTNGSGFAYALGAMSAGAGVREALEVAAQNDRGTGGKLHVHQAAEFLAGEVN